MPGSVAEHPPDRTDPSLPELLTQLSEQTSRLVRDELALAKVEMADKAKHAGVGIGLFSVAGLLGLYGLGLLLATAVLALALALPAWLAALIMTGLVLAAAGVAAIVGKKQVSTATPVVPQDTLDSVRQDVATVKEARNDGGS